MLVFRKNDLSKIRLRTKLSFKNDILSGSSGLKNYMNGEYSSFSLNRASFINYFNYHHVIIHLLNKRINRKLVSGGSLKTFTINHDVAYSNYRLKLTKVEIK